MKPAHLTASECNYLLRLARESLEAVVKTGSLSPLPTNLPENLQREGASFVTLIHKGELRGCIGVIEPIRSLAEDVRENTMGAAFYDPRFSKVQPHELEGMAIEIAILSSLKRIEYQGETELIEALKPMVDGVLIREEGKRATFLPKVWEKIPEPSLFLGLLCRKMGVPEDHWRTHPLEIYVYQTTDIREPLHS